LAELGRAYNPATRHDRVRHGVLRCATEYSGASVRGACTSRYRLPTVAINIARARYRMYPVSSPIGLYGPYGPTQCLPGLERLSVRSIGSTCASQTADPLSELRAVLLFRPCQASIYLGLGTYGAKFQCVVRPAPRARRVQVTWGDQLSPVAYSAINPHTLYSASYGPYCSAEF